MLISPTGRRIDSNQELTDEAVSRETMVARLADMGFDFDDPERQDQIAGRSGGEPLAGWAEAEVGAAIIEACALDAMRVCR
ncbi:MAG TPA: hypothetical protein VM143_00585 [Acidimicrobiales bacterium]|nr:hypothetical protein [Acidimicrobiales bacterium]